MLHPWKKNGLEGCNLEMGALLVERADQVSVSPSVAKLTSPRRDCTRAQELVNVLWVGVGTGVLVQMIV